ncbi:MAG: hypothetical protein EA424_03135 [Planctomycetaceae bacterium]|nr:MAG: hypothetical protein EA424_03135 [Planctomycetaceae bacterium]
MLEREEYVEQAYFFRMVGERLPENFPLQELMGQLRHEILATTKLPMAIDYLLTELRHSGAMSVAMKKLAHYFTPYQAYVIEAAEEDRGRFDTRVAIDILHHQAKYLSETPSPEGLFLYQFETLARNRMRYDRGLDAMARDPMYNDDWRQWIYTVRRQVGIIDLADMIFVRSREYLRRKARPGMPAPEPEAPVLFGDKEGKIAWANRDKDPMYLFAALQRHLGYPMAPRLKRIDETREIIPQLLRRMERLEVRIKILEQEAREGLDITQFYAGQSKPIE